MKKFHFLLSIFLSSGDVDRLQLRASARVHQQVKTTGRAAQLTLPVTLLATSLATLLAISIAAEPAPPPATQTSTTAPTSQPAEVTVTVRALIDGRSQLRLKGFTARWQHFDWSAPGVHGGQYEPTYIDGVAWHPNWDNSDIDPEVRIPKSMSDAFDGLNPPIPAAPMTVTLQKIRCRENASIVQEPTADNDFTTVVEFNDDATPGSTWYEVKVTFMPK
jgi:hypothetical protein